MPGGPLVACLCKGVSVLVLFSSEKNLSVQFSVLKNRGGEPD